MLAMLIMELVCSQPSYKNRYTQKQKAMKGRRNEERFPKEFSYISEHFRAFVRLVEDSEVEGFFDPLEFIDPSFGSSVVREPFFVFDVDVLDVDIIDVRLDLFPGETGVVGRVKTKPVAATSAIFELLPLFVVIEELEIIVVDRLAPCGEGDDGVGVLQLSSIKCPS